MNFFSKLTTLGRLVLVVLVMAIIGGAVMLVGKNTDIKMPSFGAIGGSNDGDYDAVLLVDTYTGWSPIVWDLNLLNEKYSFILKNS